MKISVTQADIDKGEPKICGECPIALAIRRITYLSDFVSVAWNVVEVGKLSFNLPVEATIFMDNFDRGLPVEPFEFELGRPLE